MTADLVSRLRLAEAEHCRQRSLGSSLLGEAADCIEQLRMPHAEVLKLAGKEDGADALALINALSKKVEAQRREINRLRARLGASENE